MSNNNNPLADLIKNAAPALIFGACVFARYLPAIFEKNPEYRSYKMEKAREDVQSAWKKVEELNQKLNK